MIEARYVGGLDAKFCDGGLAHRQFEPPGYEHALHLVASQTSNLRVGGSNPSE